MRIILYDYVSKDLTDCCVLSKVAWDQYKLGAKLNCDETWHGWSYSILSSNIISCGDHLHATNGDREVSKFRVIANLNCSIVHVHINVKPCPSQISLTLKISQQTLCLILVLSKQPFILSTILNFLFKRLAFLLGSFSFEKLLFVVITIFACLVNFASNLCCINIIHSCFVLQKMQLGFHWASRSVDLIVRIFNIILLRRNDGFSLTSLAWHH